MPKNALIAIFISFEKLFYSWWGISYHLWPITYAVENADGSETLKTAAAKALLGSKQDIILIDVRTQLLLSLGYINVWNMGSFSLWPFEIEQGKLAHRFTGSESVLRKSLIYASVFLE